MRIFLLKIAVSVGLIWLLLNEIDREAIAARLAQIDGGALLAALAILAVLSLVQAWRWAGVIRAIGQTFGLLASWLTVLIGQFFNQTLPSTIGGDAMRVWRAHKAGLGMAAAAHSVILDRLAGLAGLLLLVLLSLPLLAERVASPTAVWSLPIVAACGILGFALLLSFDRLPPRWRRWRLGRAAAALAADGRRVFLGRAVLMVLPQSLTIHLGVICSVYVIARGLGLDISFVSCLVLVPPVLLVSVIPISVAGWGVREGAMVTAFGFAGVAPGDALALSVLFGLAVMAVGLPGGVIWLLSGHERARGAELIPRQEDEAP